MNPKNVSPDDVFAAAVEGFEPQPVMPNDEEIAALDQCFQEKQFGEEKRPPARGSGLGGRGPLRDYLRDLQQEFQDQEEKGKV
jgi:hypothetical protein